ncbi:LOW QUALITY PROTEIN: disks large-associated protein 5 [Rhinophrynus dorsalis]
MDTRTQFTSRYKKDLSIDNLRAKVARRKSITQKENRHKEFKKSRGLTMADVNISVVKECDLPPLEETIQPCLPKGHDKTGKFWCFPLKEANERREMLQRFKEEKQLRKLKEQREKASKGVFKCGTYKPDLTFPPILTAQNAVKLKEKPAATSVSRVTRSMAKAEPLPPIRAKSTSEEEDVVFKETTLETTTDKSLLVQERKPSFAPQNFVFQPLDGLSTYKFHPLTPGRADAFLTPSFSWSPVRSERNYLPESPKSNTEEKLNQILPAQQVSKDDNSETEMEISSPVPQEKECRTVVDSSPPHVPVCSPSNAAVPSLSHFPNCSPSHVTVKSPQIPLCAPSEVPNTESMQENEPRQPEEPKHDVPYFRDILKSEIEKLTLMCTQWDKRIEMDIPEDAKDLVRTTVGQTRLLMTERFKQFEGLVDNCEFKRGEKETTCTDLEGFWDMIYFQIEDVSKKFVNLEKLEANSWQQNSIQTKKILKKKTVTAAASKPTQGDNGRAAARSRLAAIKAALKNKGKQEEAALENAAPVLPMQVEQVVFDAGFFRIESPAKKANSVRTKHSPSQTSSSPKSTTKSVQYLENPLASSLSEAVENVQSPDSPTVKSPIRKMLFDSTEEESTKNTETCVRNSEEDSANVPPNFQVIDLTKYLVPTETFSLGLGESPAQGEIYVIKEDSAASLTKETSNTPGSVVDEVFMCSPEKTQHNSTVASPVVKPGAVIPEEEVKTTNDALDFLGSCTPTTTVEK